MRKINIWALVLLIAGVIVTIADNLVGGLSGYSTMFIAYPLILISIILFVIGLFTGRKK
mgnify:CR=1 FL=1